MGLNIATSVGITAKLERCSCQERYLCCSSTGSTCTRRIRKPSNADQKRGVRQKVKQFIQNIHHFRDEGIRTVQPPSDRVVIFDEAQRAWNQAQTAIFMKRRKGIADFQHSEPELISYLDRHSDWAVIVCLVGGGQEINAGEAGISAWCDAIRGSFPRLAVWISPHLTDAEYASAAALQLLAADASTTHDDRLHLSATSMRSFRSEKVSAFVKALLDCDHVGARADH